MSPEPSCMSSWTLSSSSSSSSSWAPWDQFRSVFIMLIWVAAWLARALLVFVPQQIPTSGILGIIDSMSQSSMLVAKDDTPKRSIWAGHEGEVARTSIGRALCQILDLVNNIPTASRKYEFARSLADKIIQENVQHGGQALREVNRRALEAGFSRTIYLLEDCLEASHRQQQVEAWGWPWRMIKELPLSFVFQFVPLLPILRNRLGSVMQSPLMQIIMPPTGSCMENRSSEMAEKLAQELLWLAQRLKENTALEVAILHWSSATSLAQWSVRSNARVQKLLVKLSAFMCSGLISSEIEPPSEVTLKLLLLWLPLLCRSTHAIDETTFTSSEKCDAERILSKTIQLLPDAYQEVVLRMWLQEYVLSTSDWPNLQGCYHDWCHATRKLNYAADPDTYELLDRPSSASYKMIKYTC